MNLSVHPEKEAQPKRQLYACLDTASGKTFFASYVDRRGLYVELSSSWKTSRGKEILMMPVPENWDGQLFTPKQIQESPDMLETHVSRAESQGQFQVRLLSTDQEDMVEELHRGRHRDALELEQTQAGIIEIMKLAGRVSVESIGRLQSALRTEAGNQRLVLMDLRKLVTIPSNCLGMLHTLIKEEMEKGLIVNFLVKSDSRMEDEIKASRILDIAPMHDEYETAVAFLLQSIME